MSPRLALERGPICDPAAPYAVTLGDEPREAILAAEGDGCLTFSVLAVERKEPSRLSIPRLHDVPIHRPDGTVRIMFSRREGQATAVRAETWGLLVSRDAQHIEWLLSLLDGPGGDATWSELRWLAAAALADVCGQLAPAIGVALGYAAPPRREIGQGRKLWRALGAWPWATLPSGPLPPDWQRAPAVRLGWQWWRAQVGVSGQPSAGWGALSDALSDNGQRRRTPSSARSRAPADDAVQQLIEHATQHGLTLSRSQAQQWSDRYGIAACARLDHLAQHAGAQQS